MAIGAVSALRAPRFRIHSPSPHLKSRFHTLEAVCGGTSHEKAYGSPLSCALPWCETMRYLYAVPAVTSGTAASQIPEWSQRGVSSLALSFQPLKSPMTETERAFGAHTAKCAPEFVKCEPSFS